MDDIFTEFSGHQLHRRILENIVQGQELTSDLMYVLPAMPTTAELYAEKSVMAKKLDQSDVNWIARQWILYAWVNWSNSRTIPTERKNAVKLSQKIPGVLTEMTHAKCSLKGEHGDLWTIEILSKIEILIKNGNVKHRNLG